MKINLLLIIFSIPIFCFSQTKWNSKIYNYSVEIPKGFTESSSVSSNVDFKATEGLSTIVILVKTIPNEYTSYSIWDMLGDLETFGEEWEMGAKEYMDNPKVIKLGKTTLSSLQTFWYDYTTDNPKLYSKNYQTKKGNKLYTITLTCLNSEYNNYSSIWFRFKDRIKIE